MIRKNATGPDEVQLTTRTGTSVPKEEQRMSLKPVEYLMEVFPGLKRHGAYRIARSHPEITVRVGRRVFVCEEKLHAFIDAGGRGLGSGGRGEAASAASPGPAT